MNTSVVDVPGVDTIDTTANTAAVANAADAAINAAAAANPAVTNAAVVATPGVDTINTTPNPDVATTAAAAINAAAANPAVTNAAVVDTPGVDTINTTPNPDVATTTDAVAGAGVVVCVGTREGLVFWLSRVASGELSGGLERVVWDEVVAEISGRCGGLAQKIASRFGVEFGVARGLLVTHCFLYLRENLDGFLGAGLPSWDLVFSNGQWRVFHELAGSVNHRASPVFLTDDLERDFERCQLVGGVASPLGVGDIPPLTRGKQGKGGRIRGIPGNTPADARKTAGEVR